jgi:hypothetical protein
VSGPAEDRRYVRVIEAAWSNLLGRAAVVSPREYETIDGWRRRGIPASVVLEVIADIGKRRGRATPRSLSGLSRAVEDAWAVVAAGRTASHPASAPGPAREAPDAWAVARSESREGSPLETLLSRLLAARAGGVAPAELDAELDRLLPEAVASDLLDAATVEAARALAAFRGRMSEDELRKVRERAIVDRLRETLRLPRLTLSR